MNDIINYSENIFESIKHIDENGNEYWYARELQKVLGYRQWRSINDMIERAKVACQESKYCIDDHFAVHRKMVKIGSNTTRNVSDYKLSRYACYLIVMNGNPKKEVIALGQTYYAYQTRKQELSEKEYSSLSEDEKRLYQRDLTRKGNASLNETAKNSGVKNFDKFHNAGYKGLYNGETADDIAKRKGIRYREEILDNMGSVELVDNLFRIVQTEEKLKNDNIKGEGNANNLHFEIGREVRNSIKRMGGTMPEELPTPEKSIKEIEKSNLKKIEKD